jgi:hypothetical protein
MIAEPHKQQIPPFRCAPVGMTNYVNVNNFRDGYQAVVSLRVMPISAVGGRLPGRVTLRAVESWVNFRLRAACAEGWDDCSAFWPALNEGVDAGAFGREANVGGGEVGFLAFVGVELLAVWSDDDFS